MPAAETIAATDGLLVLKECPSCDYSLVGLPREGTCPECGRTYDQTTVVLGGWARGSKQTLATSPPRALAAMAAVWLCIAGLVMFSLGSFAIRTVHLPMIASCLIAGFYFAIPIIQRMQRTSQRPPVQVRLNSAGCSQTTSLRRRDYDDPLQILLRVIPAGLGVACLAHLFWRDRNSTFIYILVGLILFTSALNWFVRKYGRRKASKKPLAAALIPEDAVTEPPTFWRDVHDVDLGTGLTGRLRLRISEGAWWHRTWAVDLEFAASPAEVEELERQIAAWRAATQSPPPVVPASAG